VAEIDVIDKLKLELLGDVLDPNPETDHLLPVVPCRRLIAIAESVRETLDSLPGTCRSAGFFTSDGCAELKLVYEKRAIIIRIGPDGQRSLITIDEKTKLRELPIPDNETKPFIENQLAWLTDTRLR